MERTAETMYAAALARIQRRLGKNTTSDTQLNDAGHALFGKAWGGAVAANAPLKLTRTKRFGIVNTAPAPGEHWMGILWTGQGRRLGYDSFARRVVDASYRPTALTQHGKLRIRDADRGDREQADREDNCGQRSLAWLWVASQLGARGAALV